MTEKVDLSIVTPCYNEADNVDELIERIRAVLGTTKYSYEHVFIDNASTDHTAKKIKAHIENDKRIRLIVNSRNYGHIRSPYHAMLQSTGRATILLASDLQDPPEMIPEFVEKWEQGYRSVLAVKPESDESVFMFAIRKAYYGIVTQISETPLIRNVTGAGLFDRKVVNILRQIDDPYPYFRGLICEVGCPVATVPFKQPRRKRGITKNNFYTLYDIAMLGITNHSKVPLRLMTVGGFIVAILSLFIAFVFLLAKLVFWNSFQLGLAPLLVGIFFFGALQSFFIGFLGEYIGFVHTKVRNMPLVVEMERVNFPGNLDMKSDE